MTVAYWLLLQALLLSGATAVLIRIRTRAGRRQAEAQVLALRACEEKYRQVVENANDIIFTVDRDGYCVSLNRAGRAISGFRPVTSRGVHLSHLVVPEHTEIASRELHRVLQGEAVPRLELDVLNPEGKRLTLELDVFPIRVESAIVGAQGIARDITVRRELEAQLRQSQKMEAIGRLAGGVAHDFNNILTGIMAFTDLALDELDPANRARPDVEAIRRAAGTAASLTRQLLAFGRTSVVRPTILDLNQVAANLARMLSRLVGADIPFVLRRGPDAARVSADLAQVEQVILNLVVNARDAMPAGGRLTIETGTAVIDAPFASGHQIQTGDFVTLSVTDTGIGMTPDVTAQIFQPFFTTKGVTRGSGLGLATVQGIVQQAGGCITVESAPSWGTTFTVYLPKVAE